MATIWNSNGRPGLRSLRKSIEPLSLSLIEERLSSHRIISCGDDEPGLISEAGSEEDYGHVVIEVSEIDTPPTTHFPKSGFYRVFDLHASDADFLVAPPPGTVRR